MPSWRPAEPGEPDGDDEWRFAPLANQDDELHTLLLETYGRRWLRQAGLPEERLPEVPDTVELLVAEDWTEPAGTGLLTLRLTSWYTGSTYWLPGWDGSSEAAVAWIEDIADLQAGNVRFDRDRHGHTPWDV